jgi:hypothetical protein
MCSFISSVCPFPMTLIATPSERYFLRRETGHYIGTGSGHHRLTRQCSSSDISLSLLYRRRFPILFTNLETVQHEQTSWPKIGSLVNVILHLEAGYAKYTLAWIFFFLL